MTLLDAWSTTESGALYANRDPVAQAVLRQRLIGEMRTNAFDPLTGTVTVSRDRADAIRVVARHYDDLFGGAPELSQLRETYAMQETVVPHAERRQKLTSFFFWTSWAAATERPGARITYTNNWPHEPLIDNRPSSANVVWSIISVVLLLAALGGIVWWRAFRKSDEEVNPVPPERDPFSALELTPSMKAIAKYVGTVVLLFAVQVILGIITAHYTVEGQSFYGLPLAEYLPYSLSRTWHIQTAMFWIATAFLAAGLFIAPVIGGREPKYQRLGVNVLFGALLLVVGGSLAGEYLAIHQKLPLDASFWGMNIGLGLMIALNLLPIGLAQTWASVETGLWYARSAEFMQLPWIETLRWMRIVGDMTFAVGVAAFVWFMIGLITGWSYETRRAPVLQPLQAGQ
jgi:nitric oxide reductase subunit B